MVDVAEEAVHSHQLWSMPGLWRGCRTGWWGSVRDATSTDHCMKGISEKLAAETQAAETALEDKLAEAAGIRSQACFFFYKDVVHTAMG